MAINANGANIKNCGIGVVALNGGTINVKGANLSGCGIGAIADNKSEINNLTQKRKTNEKTNINNSNSSSSKR